MHQFKWYLDMQYYGIFLFYLSSHFTVTSIVFYFVYLEEDEILQTQSGGSCKELKMIIKLRMLSGVEELEEKLGRS